MIDAKPAYRVTCGFWGKTKDGKDFHYIGCGRKATFAFDRPLPTVCGRCSSKNLKIERLQNNHEQGELGV